MNVTLRFQSVNLPLPDLQSGTEPGVSKLTALVAAGPFSTSDSLSYEPLTDLMEQIQIMRPDVCILVSPLDLALQFICTMNTDIHIVINIYIRKDMKSLPVFVLCNL